MQLQPNRLQISAGCGAHHRAQAMSKEQPKMTQRPVFLFLGRLGIWREREKGEVSGTFCHSFLKTERNSFKCYKHWVWKGDFRVQDCVDLFSQTWKVLLCDLRTVVLFFFFFFLKALRFTVSRHWCRCRVLAKLRQINKFSTGFFKIIWAILFAEILFSL